MSDTSKTMQIAKMSALKIEGRSLIAMDFVEFWREAELGMGAAEAHYTWRLSLIYFEARLSYARNMILRSV